MKFSLSILFKQWLPAILNTAICLGFLLIAACSSDNEKNTTASYLRHVGDIPFDARYDDPAFQPCHEDLAQQYYAFGNGIQYEGEKAVLVRIYEDRYRAGDSKGENGYITIRFMVNCKGETGRFRMQQMDSNYDDKTFSEHISSQILDITKALDGWKGGMYNERTFDYYQLLTFKIIDSEIVSIIP